MKRPSIKIQLAVFLTSFAFYLALATKDAGYLIAVSVAAISAIAADSLITYFKTKKLAVTDSSVVTGLIIGYVLSNTEPLWAFALASIFAIGSKHFIGINKRHIFNPAAFGIFSAILLFGASTQWKGSNLWYILVPAGFYFVSKIRKMEIAVSYLAVSSALFGIQALIQKGSFLDAVAYQNYFFIFVMLIEPKTTPVTRIGKMVFGAAAAFLIFIFTAFGARFDADISSLLILNLFTSTLNRGNIISCLIKRRVIKCKKG